MRAVMIVPTGIGADIGGHSGDATSAAHLLAACCDQLILHPNVVNASDLFSMPDNALYVEGSMLDDMLQCRIDLGPVRSNKILVVCNSKSQLTINAVNAARSVHGVEAEIVVLDKPLQMRSWLQVAQGYATGEIFGLDEMYRQLKNYKFNALAIHTPIDVSPDVVALYMKDGGLNPWGGVEAQLSKRASRQLGVPVAHAPFEEDAPMFNDTPPGLAPEMICGSHLVSVLAGLRQAPRKISFGTGIGVSSIDALISPMCWGAPHEAAVQAGIHIILVNENRTQQEHHVPLRDGERVITVRNYLEAAGLLMLMGTGRSLDFCVK
jgi:hypothetical protein